MIKKLTLTEDHIKLIKNIKFDAFEMGELFNTENVDYAISEIESSSEGLNKFGTLHDELVRVKEQLEIASDRKECKAWGIDQWNLFGGTYVMEDVALILGYYDKFIPGTEESPLGKQYPKEFEDYFWECYQFIVENIVLILNLVFNFIDKGGVTPGTYKVDTKGMIWEKIN